ncbi:MAG: cytochrome c [Acidobacteria bacterium]|nr:cytochrome c [Acidobacteriota bacterium]
MRSYISICLIVPWLVAAASGAKPAVTFNEDIAPIIFNNCVSCHRAGEGAPFPLTSYEEVKKRGPFVAAVTESRLMPPWHAARTEVAYRDERRLSDEQIGRIREWVQQSMPEGDPKDLPPLPKFPAEWRLGKPDLVLQMPEPYHVPADGPDIYRSFAIPVDLPEDKWISAIEYRPQARGSSHHSFFVIDTTGQALAAQKAESRSGFEGLATFYQFQDWGSKELFQSGSAGGGNSFGGWAVGGSPRVLPQGLAYKLPKNCTFVIQAHYHPSGKPEIDQAQVGLYFADKPPERTLVGMLMPRAFGRYAGINIQPGDSEYTLTDTFTTPVDIEVFSVGAHAHYLAKDLKMTALLPGGASKTLLWIDRWDFNWQDRYVFRDPVLLAAGTRLDVRITYDNSAENPANPHDPPRRVRWGVRSEDEMGGMSVAVAARREEDLPLLQEARAAAQNALRIRTRSSLDKGTAAGGLLERYDKDGDGTLSPEERKALFRDLLEKRRQKTAQPSPKDN